jgi:hypothetical protein
MKIRRSRKIFCKAGVILFLVILSAAVSIDFHPACVNASESQPGECPDEDSVTALERILEEPEAFVGCRVIVRGTLYRMQGVNRIHYSIQLRSGGSIEVRSWAPDEKGSGQMRGEPADDDRAMPSYIGHELHIEGKLVRERDGRVVVEASIIEELKGASE